MGKVLLLLVVVALFFLVRAMLRAPAARRQGGEQVALALFGIADFQGVVVLGHGRAP